ncbi:hypothetical protein EVAR_84066_1 [Eumeta japonica]|uniref:ZP domain-containing protein n=1 Tax=Eumeta variegata TaxID=151549 RepID=A0A4C1UYP9_EUMVA|nr:hypothetical protein EVAR_84066_1 [Eumeta japonica]
MRPAASAVAVFVLVVATGTAQISAECGPDEFVTFNRWVGMSPERPEAVFVYAARGDEPSLEGVCLARCRELPACAALVVAPAHGLCTGFGYAADRLFTANNDVTFFEKICLPADTSCQKRWWALETAPGYRLQAEGRHLKVVLNVTVAECYTALYVSDDTAYYRSAQWGPSDEEFDHEVIRFSDDALGSCILNTEDKYTEPESYRVANYYTFYMENQCKHDYAEKIDRCSYEEYYNQTLKHVELTIMNSTKNQCRTACEDEEHFVCRGFTWHAQRASVGRCALHADDLVAVGSWLLQRVDGPTYYRRVICLNMTVVCTRDELVVSYRARNTFRGRVYVPGRGEQCGARADRNGSVRLTLPLYGDCDVNFAYAITKTPQGLVNRTMAYAMVMIQNNPIIQTAGDRWVRVGCAPAIGAPTPIDATVTVHDDRKPSQPSEAPLSPGPGVPNAAASAIYNSDDVFSAPPLTMYVVRVDSPASNMPATNNAVSLGELLELRIETTEKNEFEAYHLVASSRLGDSSVLLLDSRGCSTGQVDFPGFSRSWHGGVQRLSAKFKAFRFPSSHVVRFALMVRFCDDHCPQNKCGGRRSARETNQTQEQSEESVEATVREAAGVVAQGGAPACPPAARDSVPLELELVVGARDLLTADTLLRADHRNSLPDNNGHTAPVEPVVCIHELLLVALALTWLAVQVLLYRNLAEMSMQKDYQSFDNVGFDTMSTHRRVHWPDQNIDVLHVN